MKQTGEEIQQSLPKIYAKDPLEVLFRLPYTKRSALEAAGLAHRSFETLTAACTSIM